MTDTEAVAPATASAGTSDAAISNNTSDGSPSAAHGRAWICSTGASGNDHYTNILDTTSAWAQGTEERYCKGSTVQYNICYLLLLLLLSFAKSSGERFSTNLWNSSISCSSSSFSTPLKSG